MNISNNIRVWCASGGIYLWSKVVCFVLFVSWDLPSHDVSCDAHYIFETFFDVEISQATTLHMVLIVSLKHFQWWWLWVHQLGLRLFGVYVWKLLIIEPFSQWKLCIGIWRCSWCCWESPHFNKVRFNKFYFTIFKAKVPTVFDFWVDFVVENSNKLQKLGCEKEKVSWDLNVFTLGPTTQATLVKVKWRRIWREWDGKKNQKIPNFHPQKKKKGII